MKKILHTPVSNADLEGISVGDIVYLTGHIVTCRDVAHRRLVALGQELPYPLAGLSLIHI